MPTTVNGIGTHYYGKKNLRTRAGVCAHCGRPVQLSSYETRLWFVLVFIPVFPLGRKQILDFCPVCRRHIAADLEQWEAAKQLDISGALDRYRAAPTPEHAVTVHQMLLSYHQTEQATAFAQSMIEQFPEQAKVFAYLGAAALHLGRPADAERHFARALELRPDLPEARIGVAEAEVRARRLNVARALLDFLERPGAGQLYSLAPLERLALACQQTGQHAEALELFGVLLRELPALGQHAGFRRTVGQSERALGRTPSLLPKQVFSWRRLLGLDGARRVSTVRPRLTWRTLAAVGGVAALVVLGMMLANEFIRRHRVLHVTSGFKVPTTVEIVGVRTVRLLAGVQEVPLPEGDYQVRITGPVRQELRVSLHADYFDRWGDHPAWVVNVGGSALLVHEQVVYGRNPRPAALRFFFGEPLLFLPGVTHAFQPLPASLRVKSGEQLTRTHLEVCRAAPVQACRYLAEQNQTAEAIRLAEWRLRLEPGDEEVLHQYLRLAHATHELDRAERFLRAGLGVRPTQIEWHRLYQGLHNTPPHRPALLAQYDALVQAEPADAGLLYLRGRLSAARREGRVWFEKARAAGPTNPYPHLALGWDELAAGRWAEARPHLARAVELNPANPQFTEVFDTVRLALGEYRGLEADARRRLAAQPFDLPVVIRLATTLVAQERTADAEAVVSDFERAVGAKAGPSGRESSRLARRHLLYARGDFPGLEKHVQSAPGPAAKPFLFQALVEQGRVLEAAGLVPLNERGLVAPLDCLALTAGFHLAGQAEEADTWRKRAAAGLAEGDPDHVQCALWLCGYAPPTAADLDEIVLAPAEKALFLVALTARYPELRASLVAAAKRLMVEHSFPYHMIRRAAAE